MLDRGIGMYVRVYELADGREQLRDVRELLRRWAGVSGRHLSGRSDHDDDSGAHDDDHHPPVYGWMLTRVFRWHFLCAGPGADWWVKWLYL